ncbi:MAG: MFS transporter [Microcoleaceae cyanobacterium]
MKVFRTLDPQRQRSLMILFVAGLLFWSSITTLLPTLPLYIDSIGGTKQQIGLVMGAFSVGLLLSRIWLGPLADKKSRKLVLIIGTTVAAIAPMGYLVFTSLPLLMGLRVFHGISIAGFTIGYSALVADLAPPGRRGELIGYMSLVAPIGMGMGPAIGGFLAVGSGYGVLFIVSSGLGVMSLVCASLVWEPYVEVKNQVEINPFPDGFPQQKFWQIIGSRRVLVPSFVMLIVGLIFGTIVTFLPLFIQESNIDLNPGLFYTVIAIASFTIRVFTGRASDRFGRGVFICGGLVCYFLCMLILWIAKTSNIILLAAILEGSGSGLVIPMMITLMTDRSPHTQIGKFFSLCIGGFDLGLIVAGPCFGLFAEQLGYRGMFAIDAGLASVALIAFTTMSNKDLPHSIRFAFGKGQDTYAINH